MSIYPDFSKSAVQFDHHTGVQTWTEYRTTPGLVEQRQEPIKHNHQLLSGNGVHTCTGCSWQVETFTPSNAPATSEHVNQAFAKHLLTTALAEP